MEKSYIKNIDLGYLKKIGLNLKNIDKIYQLINTGIEEKLYTKTKVLYHDIKHIERVIIYSFWILNEKKNNNEEIDNEDILLLAALYHDSGRTIGAPDKFHGIIGAEIAKENLKGKIDNKTINSVGLLIKTHAVLKDKVDFDTFEYSEKEKRNIQMLSDILKDADALDRNRLKIYPFDKCKIEYLRTDEAKKIFNETNELLKKYNEARKK